MLAPIDKLSVVFAIYLAIAFLGGVFTLKLAVGGTLIVLGVLVLAWP
jgi:bacterial/archaeal transporter family protein